MSQVNGKLSSRVMNMKFMRFAKDENDNIPKDAEAKRPQIPDSSQWSFKDNATYPDKQNVKVKKSWKTKAKIIRSNVSMTEIKDCRNPVVRGRRVIGGNDALEENQKKRELPKDNDDDDEDDYDLDRIFKRVKSNKKDAK
ncbi:hypothetical protein HG535_0A07270 [Zygotorulaspora mrakii]|uniref:Uncharacterized protein n=1 Tax=Zygotorulaspora mrakii TaxID=42260 RepID=A0A7H9AWQ0_ZYGMR|nr:uncharacterized protein HG535_0A07270 [Zygotorulaspora mrakii]QLG70785.1 hypothetical protein HG535_0A07270 [Zygotorulaspora mrakii]